MLFRSMYREVEISRIYGQRGFLKYLLILLFWLWSIVGFAIVFFTVSRTGVSDNAVTLLASATLAVPGLLFWIGGMLMFGIGALLVHEPLSYREHRPRDEWEGK